MTAGDAAHLRVGGPRKASTAYLLLAATTLFWAGNWVIARGIQGQMSPVAMAFWRWLGALVILLPFVAGPIAREWRTIVRSWKVMGLLAVLGVGAFNTLSYTGLKYTTAVNGVLLNSIVPMLIIAINVIFLRGRLPARQAAGVVVAFAGVLFIVARGELATLLALELNPGDAWVLAAMMSWALYTVCLRWRPRELSSAAFTGSLIAIGVCALLPVFAWDYGSGERTQWSLATLGAVGYFALFPSVLAYFFWNAAVARVGGERAGSFLYLLPLFGTFLAWVFLDETLHRYHYAGAGLIFAGLYIITRRRAA